MGEHIGFNAKLLAVRVRARGTSWDRPSRLWRLPVAAVRRDGIADRITENQPAMDSTFGDSCRLVAVSAHPWNSRKRPTSLQASDPQMAYYGNLCTEFYDLDKPSAPPIALDFYTQKARSANGRILEPMCGSGRFLIPMIRAGLLVDGTDSSPHMIAACQRRLAIEGVCADLFDQALEALSLPYRYSLAFIPSGSIGLLTSDETLRIALSRIRTHLLPGAPLLLEFAEPDDLATTPDLMELEPRSVQCPDGAAITYTCSAHRMGASGGTLFRGKYVKSINDEVISTEDEDLVVRSHDRARLCALLRDSGFANSTCHTPLDLPFLQESGCTLVEAI